MTTFLIFVGLISILIFTNFIYGTYMTNNTQEKWEKFKQDDPITADKVERKERNNSSSKSRENNRDKTKQEAAMDSGVQLNKCSISMGYAIKMLDDIENKISIDNIESFLIIAYICRKGIINRVNKHPFWILNNIDIVIPTSQFTQISKTMEEAMDSSVNRLKRLASGDRNTSELIENILLGGNELENLERIFPNEIKPQLNMFCQIDL